MNRVIAFIILLVTFAITACGGGSGAGGGTPNLQLNSPRTSEISVDGSDVFHPRVTLDDNGNALIAWLQSNETNGDDRQIFLSEYRNNTWEHPDNLQDFVSSDSSYIPMSIPQIAMDGQGNALAAWTNYENQVFVSEYRNGIWSQPSSTLGSININPDRYPVSTPQMVMDAQDNAIIVWGQNKSNNYSDGANFYLGEYRNGVWSHTILPDIYPSGNRVLYKLEMDDIGNALIVWEQEINNRNDAGVFLSEYRNGIWHHPTSLSDQINPTGSSASYPTASMDNLGNSLVAWLQWDSTNTRQVYLSEYRNGSWIHPLSLNDHINPKGSSAINIQMDTDNEGNAVIVWEQESDPSLYSTGEIYLSEYRNGAWSHPADLTDYYSNDENFTVLGFADEPRVKMSDQGTALLVWRHTEVAGSLKRFFLVSEYQNGSWSKPYIHPDGEGVNDLELAINSQGKQLIIWTRDDSDDHAMFNGSTWQLFLYE